MYRGESLKRKSVFISVFALASGLIYVLFQVPIKHIEINRAPKEVKGEFYKKADEKATPYI
jgi:hypothetical protein